MARNKAGKGFSHRKKDPFMSIPIKLAKSQVFRSLKPTSLKVLIELLAQYNGINNGDLCAPKAYMKEWGIGSYSTLYKAIQELLEKELIVKTKQGVFSKGGKDCSLYALSWLTIDHCDGIELDTSYIKKIYKPLNQLIANK